MSLLKRAATLICSVTHLEDDDSSRLLILLAYLLLSDHSSLFHNLEMTVMHTVSRLKSYRTVRQVRPGA